MPQTRDFQTTFETVHSDHLHTTSDYILKITYIRDPGILGYNKKNPN